MRPLRWGGTVGDRRRTREILEDVGLEHASPAVRRLVHEKRRLVRVTGCTPAQADQAFYLGGDDYLRALLAVRARWIA